MQGTHNNQNNLEKEAQTWWTLSYFKTYYKVTVINCVGKKEEDNLILA